jgi:hypothetical protein
MPLRIADAPPVLVELIDAAVRPVQHEETRPVFAGDRNAGRLGENVFHLHPGPEQRIDGIRRIEFLDAVVAVIHDVDIAVKIGGERPRLVEASRLVARLRRVRETRRTENALQTAGLRIDDQDPVMTGVGDAEHAAVRRNQQAARRVERRQRIAAEANTGRRAGSPGAAVDAVDTVL